MKYGPYYLKTTHKEDTAEIHLTPRSAFITKGSDSSALVAVTDPAFRPGPPAWADTEPPTSRPTGRAGVQQRPVWEKRSPPPPSPQGLTEGWEPAWGFLRKKRRPAASLHTAGKERLGRSFSALQTAAVAERRDSRLDSGPDPRSPGSARLQAGGPAFGSRTASAAGPAPALTPGGPRGSSLRRIQSLSSTSRLEAEYTAAGTRRGVTGAPQTASGPGPPPPRALRTELRQLVGVREATCGERRGERP